MKKSFNLLLSLALSLPVLASASTVRQSSSLSNLPGFITLDSSSPYFGACQPSQDGIERRTPSCLLARTFLSRDGGVNLDAIEARVQELIERRGVILSQGCAQAMNSGATQGLSAAACASIAGRFERTACDPSAKKKGGLDEVTCKFKSSKMGLAYEAGISELLRARSIAEGLRARGVSLAAAPNSAQAQAFYEVLFQAIDISEALKAENAIQGKIKSGIVDYVYDALFNPVTIRDADSQGIVRPEAANLLSGDRASPYLSPEEARRRGLDLSLLDPPNSGLWRKPEWSIPSFKTRNYNGSVPPGTPLELLDVDLPVSVTLEKPKGKGKTPKISVTIGEGKSKLKYKMKFKARLEQEILKSEGVPGPVAAWIKDGTEVHSETVVNNLAAALGFTIEQTFFKRNVRAYLKKDGFEGVATPEHEAKFARAREELLEEIYAHMRDLGSVWNVRESFGKAGVDERGRRFIALDEASFEAELDPAQEIEVGPYIKENLGRLFKREFRGLNLFYAWISDNDTKDQNADLNLALTGDRENPYRVVYSAADMGASLGHSISKDRPNLFKPDLVKESRPGEIVLTYHTPFHGGLFDSITLADARWMFRLIGQLTPEQLREAFSGAGYHPVVAELLTQKMLRRRDQMVRALGLEPELGQLSVMTDPEKYRVKGYEDHFNEKGQLVKCPVSEGAAVDSRHCELSPPQWGPLMAQITTAVSASAAGLVSRAVGKELTRVSLTDTYFVDGDIGRVQLESGLISFLPARYLIPNPDKGSEHTYWVIDIMRVGLGHGIVDALDIDSSLTLAQSKVMGYKVHEFVRIHPTRTEDVTSVLGKAYTLYDPVKFPEKFAQALRGVREEQLRSLEPGDILVSTSYVAFGAGVYQALLGTPAGTFGTGFSASAGLQLMKVKRVMLAPSVTPDRAGGSAAFGNSMDSSRLIAIWETFDSKSVQADVSLRALLFKFPLFMAQAEARKQKDRAYRFDMNDAEQARVLTENLTRTFPEIPESLDIQEVLNREKKVRRNGWLWSLLGFFNFASTTEETEVTREDGSTYVSRKDTKMKWGLYKVFMPSTKVEVETIGVLTDQPITSLSVRYIEDFADRESFRTVYEEFLPAILNKPKESLGFEPKDTNHYLGTLDLTGTVEFKKEALSDIFRSQRTEREICETFAARLPFTIKFSESQKEEEFPKAWCEVVGHLANAPGFPGDMDPYRYYFEPEDLSLGRDAVRESLDFLSSFDKARRAYARMKANPGEKDRFFEAMGRINKLLKLSTVSSGVAGALTSMTQEKNLIRKARLTSSLSGFPGQERKIEVSSGDDSQFKALKEKYEELFIDRYFRHLEQYHVFFSFYGTKPMRNGTMPYESGS